MTSYTVFVEQDLDTAGGTVIYVPALPYHLLYPGMDDKDLGSALGRMIEKATGEKPEAVTVSLQVIPGKLAPDMRASLERALRDVQEGRVHPLTEEDVT